MKKKIKDLTAQELEKTICINHNYCEYCKLYLTISGSIGICSFTIYQELKKLEKEIEVEDEK